MRIERKGFTNSCRPTAVSPDNLARLLRRSEMYPFIFADVMDAAVPTEDWVLHVVQGDVGGGLGISTSARAVQGKDPSAARHRRLRWHISARPCAPCITQACPICAPEIAALGDIGHLQRRA